MDAVAGARYLLDSRPDLKSFAGINQNYAWGQDSWNDWTAVLEVLRPPAKVTTSQMPKFGAGQYGAEISALMRGRPEVIHSSLWGGDLEAFMLQSTPRGLFRRSGLLLIAGEPNLHRLVGNIPDGTIVGARGPHGVFAPKSDLNDWLRRIYKAKTGLDPNYPAYSAAQAQAYQMPNTEEVIAAFEDLTFQSPSGKVMMKLGKGHQAVQGTAYGTTRTVGGKIVIENIKYYPVEQVQPPEGVRSIDWIKGGLKPGRW
jgi:branched-chain amino acid transport system substrate-binding protein